MRTPTKSRGYIGDTGSNPVRAYVIGRSKSMSSIDMIMRQHIKTIFFLQDEICKIDLENSRRWGE